MTAENEKMLAELETVLGQACFAKVAQRFAGKFIYFPKRPGIKEKHCTIRKEFSEGATYFELASKYGYTERNIRIIVNGRSPKKKTDTKPNMADLGVGKQKPGLFPRLGQMFNNALMIFRR